jgi:hypothetical protein
MLELLQDMRRRRTGMFIGKPSIIRLAAFLRGYEHAAQQLGGKEPDSILPGFRDWIHARFGSSRHSWEETILRQSADDAEAQENFWKLLDEFLAQREAAPPSEKSGAAGTPSSSTAVPHETATKTG